MEGAEWMMLSYLARTNVCQRGTPGVANGECVLHMVAIVRLPVHGSVVDENSSDRERDPSFLGESQLRGISSVDLPGQATRAHAVGCSSSTL